MVGRVRERAAAWVASENTQNLVLLLARHGVIFLNEAWGPLTHEPDSPPLPLDAIFPLASLSKPITATSAMILVEDGLLGLNRPVQEYLPEFIGEGKQKVMVHHLLTHSTGLHDDEILERMEKEPEAVEVPEPGENQHPFVNKALAFTYAAGLHFEPGSKMHYSDMGMYLVGEIVRRVSGTSLDRFARERIFEPLGMRDSFYIVPEGVQDRVVRRPDDVHAAHFNTRDLMERPSPSAGVYSTALDMARFGQMFLNGGTYAGSRVLSPATVATMTRNHIPGVEAKLLDTQFPEASWGLGWSVSHLYKGRVYGEELITPPFFNHGGWGGVELWIDPAAEVVGVYFSVSLRMDEGEFTIHFADHVMNMVAAGVAEEPPHERSKRVKPRLRRTHGGRVLRPGNPQETGMNPDRVQQIIERARGWVEAGLHPSLVVLAARRGVVFLDEVFGHYGPESDALPLTREALFPMASITKLFTATATMILIEEGLLGLNRQIREFVPEFRGDGKHLVLVRHLLTHTSGLREEDLIQLAIEHGAKIDPSDPLQAFAILTRDFENYLQMIFDTPLHGPPNKEMRYAGSNFELLGQVIERAAGMPAPEFIRRRVFEPLGMGDTYFFVPESKRPRVVRREPEAPMAGFTPTFLGGGSPSTAGGTYGTARDLATFGQMFLDWGSQGETRVLSPASVAAMTRVQTPGIPAVHGEETFKESEWGLGWSIHHTKKAWAYDEPLLSPGAFCHGGSGGVFLWVDPTYDLVAVFFSVYRRLKENGLPEACHDLFINPVLAAVTS